MTHQMLVCVLSATWWGNRLQHTTTRIPIARLGLPYIPCHLGLKRLDPSG